jgi:hypothetical protein
MKIFGVSIFKSRLETAKCLVSLGKLFSLQERTVVIDALVVPGTGTLHLLVLFTSQLLHHALVLLPVWLVRRPFRGAVRSARQLVDVPV